MLDLRCLNRSADCTKAVDVGSGTGARDSNTYEVSIWGCSGEKSRSGGNQRQRRVGPDWGMPF